MKHWTQEEPKEVISRIYWTLGQLPPLNWEDDWDDIRERLIENDIREFVKLGEKASFHYADDSTSEWHLGDTSKHKALELFDLSDSDTQRQMREKAKFLWSFEMARPSKPK